MTFANKWLLSGYRFQYPLTLLVMQLLLTLGLFSVLKQVRLTQSLRADCARRRAR